MLSLFVIPETLLPLRDGFFIWPATLPYVLVGYRLNKNMFSALTLSSCE